MITKETIWNGMTQQEAAEYYRSRISMLQNDILDFGAAGNDQMRLIFLKDCYKVVTYDLPEEYVPIVEEIDGAAQLLDESIYKKIAEKLTRESVYRVFREGVKYSDQDIFRYAFVHGYNAYGYLHKMQKRQASVFRKIIVGKYLFAFDQYDGRNQRAFYIIEQIQ